MCQVSRLKKEQLLVCEERDNSHLDKELLTNRLRHLEAEQENSRSSQAEKARELRLAEVWREGRGGRGEEERGERRRRREG